MTDEELIARLGEIQGQAGLFASAAAARIEQLVATNEALTKERDEADDLAKAAFADGASNNIRLAETSYRVKWLEAKLAKAVEALDRIASITVHSGGEIHGVTAQHWRTAFEVAQDEATITLAEIKGESDL